MELYDEELADFLESFGILKLETPSGESKDCIDIFPKHVREELTIPLV